MKILFEDLENEDITIEGFENEGGNIHIRIVDSVGDVPATSITMAKEEAAAFIEELKKHVS